MRSTLVPADAPWQLSSGSWFETRSGDEADAVGGIVVRVCVLLAVAGAAGSGSSTVKIFPAGFVTIGVKKHSTR